jgi:hypothetical protein
MKSDAGRGAPTVPRLRVGGNLAAITTTPRLSLRAERGEDQPFDRLVRLAAQVLQAPLAIVAAPEDEQVYLNARVAGEFPDLDEWQTVTGKVFAQRLARNGDIAPDRERDHGRPDR